MSAAAQLIGELAQSRIVLRRHADKIVIDGPEDLVTDELIEKVRAAKADIMALLPAAGEGWTADDYRAHYYERSASAECDWGQSRAEAENRAFEGCITEWMNRNIAATPPNRCAWCKRHGDVRHVVIPFAVAQRGHTWLHPECWSLWYAGRRSKAIQALVTMGLRA